MVANIRATIFIPPFINLANPSTNYYVKLTNPTKLIKTLKFVKWEYFFGKVLVIPFTFSNKINNFTYISININITS